jgi:hypothetical protein
MWTNEIRGGAALMSQAEKDKEQRIAENQTLSLRIHQVSFVAHCVST